MSPGCPRGGAQWGAASSAPLQASPRGRGGDLGGAGSNPRTLLLRCGFLFLPCLVEKSNFDIKMFLHFNNNNRKRNANARGLLGRALHLEISKHSTKAACYLSPLLAASYLPTDIRDLMIIIIHVSFFLQTGEPRRSHGRLCVCAPILPLPKPLQVPPPCFAPLRAKGKCFGCALSPSPINQQMENPLIFLRASELSSDLLQPPPPSCPVLPRAPRCLAQPALFVPNTFCSPTPLQQVHLLWLLLRLLLLLLIILFLLRCCSEMERGLAAVRCGCSEPSPAFCSARLSGAQTPRWGCSSRASRCLEGGKPLSIPTSHPTEGELRRFGLFGAVLSSRHPSASRCWVGEL